MFEELIKAYDNLPINSKREKTREELKLVLATLELLCDREGIEYEKKAIDDTNITSESDYEDIIYSYITLIKERLGSYVLKDIERK
jgi:hypothetical protein